MAEDQDLILKLFSRGFFEILEKIFLTLPIQSILKSREVHPEWKEMIDHLFNTKTYRGKKLEKIGWLSKSPLKASVDIPHMSSFCDTHFDIQSGN